MAVLTQRQIDYIRATPSKMCGRIDCNYYIYQLLICLPLYMGIHRQEMLKLSEQSFKLSSNYVEVRYRTVPFHPEMKKLVRGYLPYRALRVRDEYDRFLLAPTGRGHGKYKLTTDVLRSIENDIADVSRVHTFSFKDLRDTYCYKVAASGAPTHAVMALTGLGTRKAEELIALASHTTNVDTWYTRAIQPRPARRRS